MELSKALGSRTVMSGSISRGKDTSRSMQMVERPLMSPDELKSMPKGQFIVMKTGTHPMKVTLRLFLDWGIRFGEPYQMPERSRRQVAYASREELLRAIWSATGRKLSSAAAAEALSAPGRGQAMTMSRKQLNLNRKNAHYEERGGMR